jgi:hypothetical protein
LAERFVFWGWWSGFFERGSQDLSNGTNVGFSRSNLFLCLHIYNLWRLVQFMIMSLKLAKFKTSISVFVKFWILF